MKTYCVIPAPPTDEQISESVEKRETMRLSLDGEHVILKWVGDTPASFEGFDTLDHTEALALMQTPAWFAEPTPNLSELSKSTLKQIAKNLGLKVSILTTKAKLIAAIESFERRP